MWEQCRQLQGELTAMRRDLHRIPEVGGQLPKTKAYVAARLEELGINYTENAADSGLVAVIRGGKEGKTLAFRSDMDALPIKEENQVDYASAHEGCMHACGHDAHMAMLLGAAKVLQENRDQLCGTVKLIFQTDEEGAKGAGRICAAGHLEDVDAVFGLHIGTILSKEIPAGTVVAAPGCVMASFDKFIIRAKGAGCHGSTPEKGVDPINIASHIVVNLQEVLAREISATKPAVLTIGHMEAGFAYNVIPEEALLEGTIRALEEPVRRRLAKRIGEIAKATAETFRGTAETEIVWGAAPVVNDAAMAQLAAQCAREIVGNGQVIDWLEAPNMGGEDFSCYLERVPGAFLFLSSSNAGKQADVPHHNPKFQIDEDVLWIGSALFVDLAEHFLAP